MATTEHHPSAEQLPVSVVVPTIGRLELLGRCLESLAACSPRATEILVVDQSRDPAVRQVIERFGSVGARAVPCAGRGVSLGRNVGLLEARFEVVLVTDDDCTVEPDWVGASLEAMGESREVLVTGRVMPVGDPGSVSSAKTDLEPHDFTGELHCGALFPNNMALPRAAAIRLGGFDERLRYAEDNDFCFRWLRAGKPLRYRPEPVVWHHDWRSPSSLGDLYRRYWHWQGVFYAKHLRHGEVRVLRFVMTDIVHALRYAASRHVRGPQRWPDPRAAISRSLPGGLFAGLRCSWR